MGSVGLSTPRGRRLATVIAFATAVALFGAGCGGGDGSTITADGSSTVAPFVTTAARAFEAATGVEVAVGISGTGGGFARFCRGETDFSNASRRLDEDEQAACAENEIEYIEFRVATDAITNVVNKKNDWAKCLTVGQLKAIWEPGSRVTNWRQVDRSFPDVPLRLYGPGTDAPAPVSRPSSASGTFDYFTGEIVGEVGASRSDYFPSEDDNVLADGVSRERGALGYFGFSYYEKNAQKLKAIAVDGGHGCVAPSVRSAHAGTYTPLSRPLFVYVKKGSFSSDDDVRAFVKYMLDQNEAIAELSEVVALSADQLAGEQRKYQEAGA
jgi:phosphate transport system substrate-binding protein